MRTKLYVLLAFIGAFGVLRAPAATAPTDSLPPVPFIIGGDDVVSPAQSGQSGPLILPEDRTKAPSAAAAQGDLTADDDKALDVKDDVSDDTDLASPPEPIKASTAVPMPINPTPAPVAKAPVVVPALPPSPAVSSKLSKGNDLDLPLPMLVSDIPSAPAPTVAPAVPAPAPVSAASPAPDKPLPAAAAISPAPVTPAAPAPAPVPAHFAAASVAPLPVAPLPSPAAIAPAASPMLLAPLPGTMPPPPAEMPKTAPAASAASIAPIAPMVTLSPGTSAPMLPPLPKLETPPKVPTTVGADGVAQDKGIEHVVGSKNALLPPVEMAPAVAVVGEGVPELHVSQIPLEDLLGYLKDYTPRHFSYELSAPLYVSVDLKAKSIDEIMGYLRAHYPVDISTDGNTIFIRPATAKVEVQPTMVPAPRPEMTQAVPPAYAGGYGVPMSVQISRPAYMPAPAVVQAVPVQAYYPMPQRQPLPSVSDNWNDVRIKSKLYDLEKQREALLKQHEKIEEKLSSYEESAESE